MPSPSDPAIELAAAMAAELKTLLDAVPASRQVLQHLAVVEKVLKLHGLDGLADIPEAALVKAHGQLAGLPLTPKHVALSRLLSLLSLQAEPPSREDAHAQHNVFMSSFLTEEKLQVSEGSHSDFIRLLDDPAADKR
jgi:hypothetical protein